LELRDLIFCVVLLIAVTVFPGCRLIPSRASKTKTINESRNLWNEGAMFQERGNLQQAEHCLSQAVALNENDAEIRRTYSETLWRLGKKQESVDQLTEALKLTGRSDTRILLSLAEKCFDLGHEETAVACAEKAIDSADAKWVSSEENRVLLSRAWVIRARGHWRNNETEQALNDYHKAISLCPKDPGLLSELATLHETMGQPERALAAWHSVSRLGPPEQEPQHVVFGRGHAYMAMRQYQLACDQFAQANERWPQDINTYSKLVEAQLACGRTREASVVAQRAFEIAPNDPLAVAANHQVQIALSQQHTR